MRVDGRWKHEPSYRLGASTGAKSTGVKQRGNNYHRKVYKTLALFAEINLPGWKWLDEPWFRKLDNGGVRMWRSPDGLLLHPESNTAVVVEVKLNWKDGRDRKLLDEYLPIVTNAFQLDTAWPLLITQCLRGYEHPPLLGLRQWEKCQSWLPGEPTPVMLLL
jgi:hypothetical protein